MVLTRSSLVAAYTVLVLGALSGIADAQVSVEVLPLPRHPLPQFAHSRQSLPIGISRDGRFVSGNGFESRTVIEGIRDPIAWQIDRTTGQLSYPGEEPSAETGQPFLPNRSAFVQVSRSGQAGVVGGVVPLPWHWVWDRGSGHTRIVSGELTETGGVVAVSSNGRTAIGEVINNVTHDWSVVWHDGVWQRPTGPDPYEYSVLLSDDGSTFTNELNQIYRFGAGWTILPQDVDLLSISSDGRRIAGRMAGNGVIWSAAMGFESLPPEIAVPVHSNSDLTAFVYGDFLWTQWGGLLDVGALVSAGGLLPTGFALDGLNGVSDDGTVLSGSVWNAGEQRSLSIVVTIPAPGALPTIAALGLLVHRRRRATSQLAPTGTCQ